MGRIFREMRLRHAWRQTDPAERAGVSQAPISRIGPARTAAVRRWLRRPSIPLDGERRGFGGIWFLPLDGTGSTAARVRHVQRVRLPRLEP